MNRTMLKSKKHRATVTEATPSSSSPTEAMTPRTSSISTRVVHGTQENEIRTIDNEVATLLGAPTA
jgi:hypothetical protein